MFMNASPTNPWSSGWLAALVFTLLTLSGAFGQASGIGAISGRVSDSGSGRSLQGAVVKVVGTTAVDVTDQDGRYSITGVPAGVASVEVEYVGLDLLRQTVVVSAGATATLNAELKSEVHRMRRSKWLRRRAARHWRSTSRRPPAA